MVQFLLRNSKKSHKYQVDIKTIIIFLFIIFGFVRIERICAQPIFPKEIQKSFTSGDSKKLASFFDQNVELLLLNKGNVYSKAQAELIMKDFFIKHTPKSFVIENEDIDKPSKFAIALLHTEHNGFRVFIAYHYTNHKYFINQMIISKLSSPND